MIIGVSVGQEICLILGQVSLSLHYLNKKPPDGYVWSLKEKQNGQMKNQNSLLLEGYEEYHFIDPEDKELVQRDHSESSKEIGNIKGSSHALQGMQEKQTRRDP